VTVPLLAQIRLRKNNPMGGVAFRSARNFQNKGGVGHRVEGNKTRARVQANKC